MYMDQSSGQIATTITGLKEQIAALELEESRVKRTEKQLGILRNLDAFTLQQVKAMPDFELADKCRDTTFYDVLSALGGKLGFNVDVPMDLMQKSVAQVLYVLDYIENDAKLDEPETLEDAA